jgi:capsular polysaccharide transport system ATP-binding protein
MRWTLTQGVIRFFCDSPVVTNQNKPLLVREIDDRFKIIDPKVYDTREGLRTVLNSVNLRIAKGEKAGILGRNGAGKSTLMRLISDAELPIQGRIGRKIVTLENITKVYDTRQGPQTVLDGVNLRIAKGEKVGILGRNGAGKSTLMRLISGAELPTHGRINRDMSVSWPLAFGGGFQGSLTGLDNLRFICRVYGVNYEGAIPFVEEFSELGSYLREPVKKYSSGMRARLAFALSMAVEFDCFLIDEIIAVGDSRFHARCHEELFEKRKDRGMILVSHDPHLISDYCDHAGVLIAGKLHMFDQVDEAFAFYQEYSG